MDELYPVVFRDARAMIFVDGENFTIRYGEMLKQNPSAAGTRGGIWHEPGVALWSQDLNPHGGCGTFVVRRHFYTSVEGDEDRRHGVEDWLKARGIEAPRVYHRTKTRGSKQVDINLTTEMLTGAHRKHFDIAILISGDADYIPLIRAVRGEGARVHLWAFSSGLSPRLKTEADYFTCLDRFFKL